jgi:hypothetical protein
VKEMLDANNMEAILHDKIALKLLRLHDVSRNGFILADFPTLLSDAEMLEEFRGGLNAFVHLSVPEGVSAAIEKTKITCNDCSKTYYN